MLLLCGGCRDLEPRWLQIEEGEESRCRLEEQEPQEWLSESVVPVGLEGEKREGRKLLFLGER
jgi:hypothetical protein